MRLVQLLVVVLAPALSSVSPCPLAFLAKPSYLATNRMKCRARQSGYQPPTPSASYPHPVLPLTACKSLPRCPLHCAAFVSDIWDTFTKTFYVFSSKSFAKDVLPVCPYRLAASIRILPVTTVPVAKPTALSSKNLDSKLWTQFKFTYDGISMTSIEIYSLSIFTGIYEWKQYLSTWKLYLKNLFGQ